MRNNKNRSHSIAKKRFLDTLHGKIIFASLCVVLTLAGSVLIAGEVLLSKINRVPVTSIAPQSASQGATSSGPVQDDSLLWKSDVLNILLIGNDTRGGEKYGNSDTMLMLSSNKNTNQMKVVSFLRDLYVPIEGVSGRNRINASFESGGPSLLIDTIQKNFKVRIDKYACIDFKGFEKAIDSVGGVTITLTKSEADEINGDPVTYFTSIGEKAQRVSVGTQKLNGAKALAYARIRHIDNDFNRTQRQRNVLSSLMSSMKNSNPFTLLSLADSIFQDNMKTDLNNGEIEQLVLFRASAIMKGNLEQFTVPADGAWTRLQTERNGWPMDVIDPDFPKNRELLKNFLYGTADSSSNG